MSLFQSMLHSAWRSMLAPAAKRFQRALMDPRAAQAQRLRRLMPGLAAGDLGRRHGLTAQTTLAEFRQLVPIREAVPAEATVPCPEDERAAATEPWLFDLLGTPGLRGTRLAWSLSTSQGEAPDPDHRPAASPWLVDPLSVGDAATVRELLRVEDLGLICTTRPELLTRAMAHLGANFEASLEGLSRSRLRGIRDRIAETGALTGEAIWPKLTVITTPLEGPAARHRPALRAWFPRTVLQDRGLRAGDWVVSLPLRQLERQGAVLAVASHFLEFLDLDRPGAAPRLAHQLVTGAAYAPIVTSANGCARQRLGHVLRCTGRHLETPTVRLERPVEVRHRPLVARDSASILGARAHTLVH
jgi:hypothetical protein